MRRLFSSLAVICVAVFCADVSAQSGTFLTEEEFLQRAFPQSDFQQEALWLNADLKQTAKTILGHDYHRLRVRYNHNNHRSAWILEEVGKDRPITMGVVIENNQIIDFSVLVFRESRGGEIRHDFFTRQFNGLQLKDDRSLSGHIDGITGATLSVRAARKVATLALFFHQQAFESELAQISQ